MKKRVLFVGAFAFVATISVARAEIMCTEQGGCWETGMRIRLGNPYRGVDTTVTSRENPNVKIDARNFSYVNDAPHQTRVPVRPVRPVRR
jgi:hypothetical protein